MTLRSFQLNGIYARPGPEAERELSQLAAHRELNGVERFHGILQWQRAAAWDKPRSMRRPVARISNLLYRGFPIRRANEVRSRSEFADAQPNGIRRYSRLEICATTERFMGRASVDPTYLNFIESRI